MKYHIGKEIDVDADKDHIDWYYDKTNEFYYHSSWLYFGEEHEDVHEEFDYE